MSGPERPLAPGSEPDEVEAHRMPLIEHLRELRTRVMWSAGALGLGMIVSLSFTTEIYGWLTAPVVLALEESGVPGGLAIVNSPFEGIYAWLRVAFVGAVALASPMIALQTWLFVAPGLYRTERRIVLPLAAASTALFIAGALFAYYVIFPFAFPFFLQVIDAQASLSVSGYLSAVIRMMGAFGVCFQLPIASFFLARMGLVDHRDLAGAFRYAVVAIFAVSALITPPDVITQILLALPLIALYLFSIGVAWLFTTKDRSALGAD